MIPKWQKKRPTLHAQNEHAALATYLSTHFMLASTVLLFVLASVVLLFALPSIVLLYMPVPGVLLPVPASILLLFALPFALPFVLPFMLSSFALASIVLPFALASIMQCLSCCCLLVLVCSLALCWCWLWCVRCLTLLRVLIAGIVPFGAGCCQCFHHICWHGGMVLARSLLSVFVIIHVGDDVGRWEWRCTWTLVNLRGDQVRIMLTWLEGREYDEGIWVA